MWTADACSGHWAGRGVGGSRHAVTCKYEHVSQRDSLYGSRHQDDGYDSMSLEATDMLRRERPMWASDQMPSFYNVAVVDIAIGFSLPLDTHVKILACN